MSTTQLMNDSRLIDTIDKIVAMFRKQNFNPNEAAAVLCSTCALIIANLTDSYPQARGKEEQMAEDYKQLILANLALLQGRNPIPTAGEA